MSINDATVEDWTKSFNEWRVAAPVMTDESLAVREVGGTGIVGNPIDQKEDNSKEWLSMKLIETTESLDDNSEEPWCGWDGRTLAELYDEPSREAYRRVMEGASPKQDDGLTATHYELPEGATELKHLIWYKDMNAQVGEAFRSLYRLDDCAHSKRKRNINKVIAYMNQELERMDIYD
jgi:hypothetical protein